MLFNQIIISSKHFSIGQSCFVKDCEEFGFFRGELGVWISGMNGNW